MRFSRTKILLALSTAVLMMSCSKFHQVSPDLTQSNQTTSSELYEDAKKALEEKSYYSAMRAYERLDVNFPFSSHAEQALLEVIYAYYKQGDFGAAEASAKRFIHEYPRSAHADYAYYMKGLCNYAHMEGFMGRLTTLDPSWRDLKPLHDSYEDFQNLIRLYPHSEYVPAAKGHLIYLRNVFAQHELNVAKYYFAKRDYVASSNRVSYLIQQFPQAPQVQEALALYEKNKIAMGLPYSADVATQVAVYNEMEGGK